MIVWMGSQSLLKRKDNIIIQQFNSSPQMKYLAAYALLALSGKKDISPADIKSVLGSVQSAASDDDIKKVIDALKSKPIHQLIAEGQARLGAGSAPVASLAPAAKTAEKKEAPKKQQPKKKEQPKKAEEEEQGMDMGGLFD